MIKSEAYNVGLQNQPYRMTKRRFSHFEWFTYKNENNHDYPPTKPAPKSPTFPAISLATPETSDA